MNKFKSLYRNILNQLVLGAGDAVVAEAAGIYTGLPPGTMTTIVAAKSLVKGTSQTIALKAYDDIFDRQISQLEQAKVIETFDVVEQVFWEFVKKEGKDEAGYKFNGESPDYQNAYQVAEGVLFQSMRENERKKLNVLGSFYGKCLYEGNENWEYLHHTLKMTDRLTYRQFIIIRLICNNFPNCNLDYCITAPDACVETMDLLNYGIWNAPGAFLSQDNSKPIQLKSLQPTQYAQKIYDDMMLERIGEEDVLQVLKTLQIKHSDIINEVLTLEEEKDIKDSLEIHEI